MVQISLTAKEKGKRKLREHWREWPGKERGNKSEREVSKKKKNPFFINAVSTHYLGLLLAWLFHPITRGAYAIPVVELATSFTPCSICWRQ